MVRYRRPPVPASAGPTPRRRGTVLAGFIMTAAVTVSLAMSMSVPIAGAATSSAATPAGELIDDMSKRKDEGTGSRISATTVAGRKAFKHTLTGSDKRAEFAFAKTDIGVDYTYRWSMYFPPGEKESAGADIVAQWAAHPTPLNGRFPCGGVGHRLSVKNGGLRFDLQRPSRTGGSDAVCTSTQVVAPEELRGKWLDFEMQARWTDRSDGYTTITLSVDGAAPRTVLDYRGITFWSAEREDRGPYFKMGYYNGSAAGGATVSVYTADYQLFRGRAAIPSATASATATTGTPSPTTGTPSPTASSTAMPSGAVTVYVDRGLRGASQSFPVGRFRSRDGQLDVVGSDAISSLRVATGYTARLCQDSGSGNGGGVCTTFTAGEHPSLSADLDDETSFIEVGTG